MAIVAPPPEFIKAACTPLGFSKLILGLNPYDWQARVMWDIAQKGRVALACCNGGGKTSVVAASMILWHCTVFPRSQVVTTAGVFRQVKEQLWNTLRSFAPNLGAAWAINAVDLCAPNGSKAIGFSTDDPGKFEGWHEGKKGEPLLMILDEAKSIPEPIFQAVERCQPTRLLLMSSTGGEMGEFYNAFNSKKKYYKTHKVTSYDCPHLKPEWINEQIEMWGRDHPLIRSMIFSEFVPSYDQAYVIPSHIVSHCFNNPPAFQDGPKTAFIDWAAGGDETVIAIKRGNRIEPLICWKDPNTSASCARAVMELRKANVQSSHVWGDDGGLGKPMNDNLREMGFPINRANNGSAATDKKHFVSSGAEKWFKTARVLEKCEVILPNDQLLFQQLSNRKQELNESKGTLGIESKEDMRNRGVSSPDRADGVVGVITCCNNMVNLHARNSTLMFRSDHDTSDSETAGFYAGD